MGQVSPHRQIRADTLAWLAPPGAAGTGFKNRVQALLTIQVVWKTCLPSPSALK